MPEQHQQTFFLFGTQSKPKIKDNSDDVGDDDVHLYSTVHKVGNVCFQIAYDPRVQYLELETDTNGNWLRSRGQHGLPDEFIFTVAHARSIGQDFTEITHGKIGFNDIKFLVDGDKNYITNTDDDLTDTVSPSSSRGFKLDDFAGGIFKIQVKGNFFLPRCEDYYNPSAVIPTMWHDMDFSDFSIVASGGKEIHCHKVILCAASPVLKALISADMEEARQGFYNLDENEDDLRALLHFMYIGSLPVEVDSSTLLSLIRLSDYLQMPGMLDECASLLLPLVCEDNILAVLNVLAPLRRINEACNLLFAYAIQMVKHSDDMLLLVCSNVKHLMLHETHHAVQSTSQWNHAVHADLSAAPQSLSEYERRTTSRLQSSSMLEGGKQHGSQASTNGSNDGPSHMQSGSSERSEHPNHESKDPTVRQTWSTHSQQADLATSGPSNLRATVSLEPQNFEAVGLESPKLLSDNSADESAVAGVVAGQTAGSSPRSQQRSSGPRRKTRRGNKMQKWQCSDETSIPDTNNAQHSQPIDAYPQQCLDQTSIPDTYNPWDSMSIDA